MPAEQFLEGLQHEVSRVKKIRGQTLVHQIHLGGGSPTFLTPSQIVRMWEIITNTFSIAPHAELACEIDPRTTTEEQLLTLKKLGFNRLSLGVQDFDTAVQSAINRTQSFELENTSQSFKSPLKHILHLYTFEMAPEWTHLFTQDLEGLFVLVIQPRDGATIRFGHNM